ncbi:MAG: hypothetical protein KKA35_03405 [Proteobacteria bacterium]|nr:hypothetical protein [Pseudomonadota bacterium]
MEQYWKFGDLYFIRHTVVEMQKIRRAKEMREWMKRIILAVLIIVSMAVPVILTLAAK